MCCRRFSIAPADGEVATTEQGQLGVLQGKRDLRAWRVYGWRAEEEADRKIKIGPKLKFVLGIPT